MLREPIDNGLFNSIFAGILNAAMYWTLELASYLEDAPWPATKDELIDFSIRSGAPLEVVENLQELEDDGQPYESIEEIWRGIDELSHARSGEGTVWHEAAL